MIKHKLSLQIIKSTYNPSILLSCDNDRYLFNIPEGFQRFYKEHNVKLCQGSRIFFTQIKPGQINGLFGIMQTLAFEKQAIGTKLYGPKGLTNFINILRHMDIGKQKTYNFSSYDFGGDHLLGTNLIPLDYQQPIQINEQNCNDSRQFIKNGIFKDQYLEIIPIQTQSSIQYIIKTQPQKGQILKEKLDEFNIPQNLMKELVQKGYIEIKGKIIEIQNVSSQDSPSQVLMILDIQTQQELQEFLQQTKQLQDIYLTIHLSKQSIEPFYKQIIDTFKCRHIFAYYNQNDDFQYVSEYIQDRLHNSYPQNFPQYKNQFYFQYPNIECYQPLLEYTILPIRRQKDALNLLKDQLADIKEKVFPAPQDIIQQEFNDDKRLSFLGTGSMIPGKIRNVMSILIETQNYAIFLDCGEGTYKQVIDHGSNLNKEIIIWISHSHSDHHLGLMELLYQLRDRLVYVILPAIMVPWLNYYQSSIEKFNIKIIVAQSFEGNIEMQDLISEQYKNQEITTGPQIVLSQDQDFQQNFQDFLHKFHTEFQINITQVEHCPQAYGIKITFADNRAVSYSGDTRPCVNFCNLAQNSSIMIHEATFTDDLEENAKKNMHCTISDAINIGRQSNSKAIVLTHFSQRLAKGLQQTEQYQDKNIVFTCDHFSGYFSEYETLGPMSIQISKILTDD